MNYKHSLFKLSLLVSNFLLISSPIAAADYFETLTRINKPPQNSIPVLPCSVVEKKRVIALFKQDGINDFDELKLIEVDENKRLIGKVYNRSKEWVEIYKGDFSNEGEIEYALVVDLWGSAHSDEAQVYKLINNHLIKLHLQIPYSSVASPFAIIQDGKTYLRFIHLPIGETNYDQTQLRLCTYFWKGKKLNLVSCVS